MKYRHVIRGRVAIVLSLLGAVALLAGVSMALMGEGAKVAHVEPTGDFLAIANALKTYKLMTGSYPSTAQGLKALVERPDGMSETTRWTQVMKKVPTDPWGNEYGYVFPGRKDPSEFEIISKGKDGTEGGEQDFSSQDA